MKMKVTPIISFMLIFLLFANNTFSQDAAAGEENFKKTCAACHSVGQGRLVGPDLAGIDQRQSEDWIIKFVKSSQTLIKSGDKYADSIYQAYNKVMMPDHPGLSDDQIKGIIAYIKEAGSASAASAAVTDQTTDQVTTTQEPDYFTATNMILLGVIVLMCWLVIILAGINRKLADQIQDFHSSDRAFFRKK